VPSEKHAEERHRPRGMSGACARPDMERTKASEYRQPAAGVARP